MGADGDEKMTLEILAELAALDAEATPGPWEVQKHSQGHNLVRMGILQEYLTVYPEADARLIATLRTHARALIALATEHAGCSADMEREVQVLEAKWDTLRAERDALFHRCVASEGETAVAREELAQAVRERDEAIEKAAHIAETHFVVPDSSFQRAGLQIATAIRSSGSIGRIQNDDNATIADLQAQVARLEAQKAALREMLEGILTQLDENSDHDESEDWCTVCGILAGEHVTGCFAPRAREALAADDRAAESKG